MHVITLHENELLDCVKEFATNTPDLLFRGLGEVAESVYRNKGFLNPFEGNLSVGTGVFFSNSFEMAKSFMKKTLILCKKSHFEEKEVAIDCRIQGHEAPFRAMLESSLGKKVSGYEVLYAIQEHDTITYEGGPVEAYVYTRRGTVHGHEILAELRVA